MLDLEVFNVAPCLPPKLDFLETLSRNMWWCSHREAVDLFRRINPGVWKEVGYNPVRFLNVLPQKVLETLASDDGFLAQMKRVREAFDAEVTSNKREPGAIASPTSALSTASTKA